MAAPEGSLLLVHGAGQAGRMWKAQATGLSDRYTVVAPDLPGFGGTAGPFTVASAAEHVGALVRQVDPPVFVVGHSLGGVVAMTVAAAMPQLVSRLVISAAPIAPGRSAAWLFKVYRRLPWFAVKAIVDVSDRQGWLDVVDAIVTTDVTPLLPVITTPTLVLCGAKDRMNLRDSRTLATKIVDAELTIVPGAGHLWPVTMPAEFNRILGAYLAR